MLHRRSALCSALMTTGDTASPRHQRRRWVLMTAGETASHQRRRWVAIVAIGIVTIVAIVAWVAIVAIGGHCGLGSWSTDGCP